MNVSIKQNDTKEIFTDTLTINDVAINLTDCTVKFIMKHALTGAVISQDADIVSAVAGTVKYQPVANDVAVAGTYSQEWEVTFPDDSVLTVPNDGYNTIAVLPDLG